MFKDKFSQNFIWKKEAVFFLLLLLMGMMLVTGCGTKQQETVSQESPKPTTVTEKEEAKDQKSEAPEGIVIIDQQGREVLLPDKRERIVSTHRPLTFFVFAVGGQEKLVAVDNNSATSEFLQAIHQGIADLPTVGTKKAGLNIESILAAEPDVVILADLKGNEVIIEQLDTQGIPTVVVNPESVEQMKETALILGVVFGQEKQAAEVIAYYEETEQLITERLSGLSEDQKKRVYMTGSEVLKTQSTDMYQHYLIEKAGGINVAGELTGGTPQISSEQLVTWNPEVFVALSYINESLTEVVADNPQLASVQAIQDDEIYLFPSDLVNFDYPEPTSALGMLWLAQKLYPKQFTDIHIGEEADEYFTRFYGKTFSEIGGVMDAEWK